MQKESTNKNNPSIKLDLKFLNTASLLHDVGRFQYPPWKESVKHGVAGARVLLKENLPRHANVAQNHLGSGITKQVIKNKKLPFFFNLLVRPIVADVLMEIVLILLSNTTSASIVGFPLLSNTCLAWTLIILLTNYFL
mgnify:CR=1 FL=1